MKFGWMMMDDGQNHTAIIECKQRLAFTPDFFNLKQISLEN